METSLCCCFCWLDLHFRETTYAKNLGLLNEKGFFIIHIMTLNPVTSLALKWLKRWTDRIRVCFVVTLVPYEVGQFFLFPSLFLILSKTKTSYVVSVNIGQKVTRGGLETSELHCTKNAFCWVPLSNIIFKLQVSAGPSHVAIFYEMKGNWQDGK